MRTSSSRLCRDAAALLWTLSTLLPQVAAQALGEPSGNQILYGAWIDTAHDGVSLACQARGVGT
jgi:hypothetical protein